MVDAIPVVLIPKNWLFVVSWYSQVPVSPFLYKNDKVPVFGNPMVESTSMNVCPTLTWPIIFVFACTEKLPYINSFDASPWLNEASRLIL